MSPARHLIKLAPGVAFDLADPRVLSDGLRIAIVGESGAGKSSAAALIAGQVLEQGMQLIILDPHGEYSSLSAISADLVLVGYGTPKSLDLWHSEDSITKYLGLISRGKSILFNLRTWAITDPDALDLFAIEFMRGLYKQQVLKPRRTFLVVDEAYYFAPQVQGTGERKKVRIFVEVATGGRKYGLGCVFCTQRPALVDKSVISTCNVRVFLRTTDFKDWKVIRDYIPDELAITHKVIRKFESGEGILLTRWTPDARVRLLLPPVAPATVLPALVG